MKHCLRSLAFWLYSLITGILLSVFFAWEMGMLNLPSPPRPPATENEILFSIVLIVLLAINVGLFGYAKTKGTCPIGTGKATGAAGAIGAAALLCPVCILVPFSLLGISLSLAFLSPFLPLLRIIAILIALMSIRLLWPKK